MPYTQDGRICTVSSPLGRDVLLLRSLTGREAIGELFQFDLELASERGDIDFQAIVGSSLTVEVELESGVQRCINGIVSRFSQGGSDDYFVYYRAQIVPWLFLLTRRTDCRIFQDMTVPEIIQKVFAERGFGDFEDKLEGSYPPRVYCVQYRETDYNFVCRLMEESGISFYFTHDAKRHMMVLFDAPSGNIACEQAVATCIDATTPVRLGNVWDWSKQRELGPGACALTDYNFEQPSTDLCVSTSTAEPIGGNDNLEIYDYPGEYQSFADGEAIARRLMEAEEAASTVASGTSDCALFVPGTHFQLLGHYRGDCNCEYLLTAIWHSAQQGLRVADKVPSTYENSFSSIPYTVPWRARRLTPKPVVQGVQTAVVVGPPGEEIYVDKHARVKVQFHWDREGKRDDKSSCWIRVSQLWAGKSFGGISIPRIGQEVIVEFLEGDPDRPIITGRVYNAEQSPPFPLPAGASNAGIKSRSTPGGGGYNQFSMDDTKGQEGFTIHAQYNMDTTVENDQTLTVHNNRTSTVDVDETQSVGANQTISIGADQAQSVGANRNADVAADETLSVGGAQSESVGGDRTINIAGADSISVGGARTLDVGADLDIAAGAKLSTSSTADTDIASSANISVSASGTITLSAGGSTIELSAAGIKITSAAPVQVQGAMIKLN